MRNWAGNVSFAPARYCRPGTVDELRELVAGSERVRALGTGHSFNPIADTTGTLISTAGLPAVIEVDSAASVVEVSAGLRYGELAGQLHRQGFALHNLASLPHISVAGACATATHGSGDHNANLATAVAALELVTADGELRVLERTGDTAAEFSGSVVGLGALGIVTRLWLDIEPTYSVRQHVYNDLSHAQLIEHLDQILAGAYSTSLFTRWQPEPVYQMWRKRRVTASDDGDAEPVFFGATAAAVAQHPLPGMTGDNCTEQFGRIGPWHERLPHFRLEFIPSRGEELQSEYLVPRQLARQAVEAVAQIGDRVSPVLHVCELRSIAADELWMSPSYQRDSLGLHFTWLPDAAAVAPVLVELERRLAPMAARPHWAKLFCMDPAQLRGLYDRYADFEQLLALRDPDRKFANRFVERYLSAA
ncbi:MAG TPA: FAD-binding protein [Jatrophihabitans sp.]|jgi:xylitol oxidase|uniref:FAD-binding protein n=1 Tax=Jatrophihabitans sp. TaxID=1932789 RepID=UPI002EE8C16A